MPTRSFDAIDRAFSSTRPLPVPWPRMLFADPAGRVFEHPRLSAAYRTGSGVVPPPVEGMIALPAGAKLALLPGRVPVGWDSEARRFERIETVSRGGRAVSATAVAGILPPGHVRTYLPAFEALATAPVLPLWGYAAAGWSGGRFLAAAVRVDTRRHYATGAFSPPDLPAIVKERLSRERRNRLLTHLGVCATDYFCNAGQNVFLDRWEAGLPVARACNSECLGCLSHQPDSSPFGASHHRIGFRPTAAEIVAVAAPHLSGERGWRIASFGQGCEGEPLLETPLIAESVRLVRKATPRGTIHLNTNASIPEALVDLAEAGLDSVRVSLSSADPARYDAYFQPRGYGLAQVVRSTRLARERGLFVSVNLFVMPGLTDARGEVDSLLRFVEEAKPHLIQMKTLCVDPDYLFDHVPPETGEPMGVLAMMRMLKNRFPELLLGSFNVPRHLFPG